MLFDFDRWAFAKCSLGMVDVVRRSRDGADGPCALCRPFSGAGGILDWAVLPASLETFLLVAVSEFGDLGSYSSLSRACRFHRRHLATSLHLLCMENQSGPCRCRACHVCGELGLARPFAWECGNCEDCACEDCVAWASFWPGCDRLALRRPESWICVWCVGCDGYEDLQTVPSLKTWVVNEAWDVAHRVVRDYDFVFWMRLVHLSGEGVVDEQGRQVGLVYASWSRDLETVWNRVYWLTGRRVRQIVLGVAVVDSTSARGARWSQFLSRSEARLCTENSPYLLPVLTRGWW